MTKDHDLAGMTVNERLFALGLFPEFDRAALARDREALIEVLLRAHLSQRQAVETTEALLHDPARYGF
jgi:hypothetical protein